MYWVGNIQMRKPEYLVSSALYHVNRCSIGIPM